MNIRLKKLNIFLLVSFGLLGFTALIFQVVFAKKLMLIFGLTAPAVATVLAVYFSGLAIGGFIFGRIIDRLEKSAHKIYLSFFVFVGIYGILSPWLFDFLSWSIQAVNKIYPLNFSGFNFFAFVFSFVFLIFPSILFGGAFPVINKMIIHKPEEIGRNFSLLYFIETAGGVVGALFAGFWLIPSFGNNATIISASILSVLVAVSLFYAIGKKYAEQLRVSHNQDGANNIQDSNIQPVANSIFIPTLFLTGFLALALEVLYTKTLILFIGSSTYAFSLILIVFLSGIALGSLVISWFIDRIKRQYAYFGLLLGLTGFWLFLTLRFFEKVPFWYLNILKSQESFDFSAVLSTQFLTVFFVIFPATFLMGIIFPLGIKLAGLSHSKLGQGIGKLYFANTLGGVLGSLVGGFILLPFLGYHRTMILLILIYLLLGGIFIVREKTLDRVIKGAIVFFLIFWAIFSVFSAPWAKRTLTLGSFMYAPSYISFGDEVVRRTIEADKLIFYKEGLSNVAVIRRGGETILKVNGKADASNGLDDLETEILTGVLPMVFHSDPKDVLVIGLGSGITLGAITQFDAAKDIDVAEIDPAIIKAAEYFKKDNNNALNDSRVKIIMADGRNHLSLTDKKYDVISSQLSNLWAAGNVSLFTKEYYELAKSRLKEKGLMLQWIHAYSISTEDVKSVFKTFQEVFPKVYLFNAINSGDLLIIGSLQKDKSILNFNELKKKFDDEKITNELGRIYITNPYELAAYLVAEGDRFKGFVNKSAINTDDKNFLEFSAPKAMYQETIPFVLQDIDLLRSEVNLNNFAIDKKDEIEQFKKYFEFRKALIPTQAALSEGDLFGAMESYKKAKELGLSQLIIEANILRRCNVVAMLAQREGGSQDAEKVWEKCGTNFNTIEVGNKNKQNEREN